MTITAILLLLSTCHSKMRSPYIMRFASTNGRFSFSVCFAALDIVFSVSELPLYYPENMFDLCPDRRFLAFPTLDLRFGPV